MLDFNETDLENIYNGMCITRSRPCANDTIWKNRTSVTSNDTDEAKEFTISDPLWLTIVIGMAASIVIIVTILENSLVLLSFVLERSLRQPTNYFIASLAMSDLLIGTFSMPCFTLYLLLGYWPLGEIICDLWLSLDWTVCLASQYTVFLITTDRFCSVKIPAKYRNWRTEKKVGIMIALSWTIPSLLFFTTIIGWQYFVNERTVKPTACEVQFLSDPLFSFLLTIGYYWITLIVMVSLYIGIYRVVLALQRNSNEKQMKMNHVMGIYSNKSFVSKGEGKPKESNNRVDNNYAYYLSYAHENYSLATSVPRHSDYEYCKPSEEDRSSSPAFASDEDEGSSLEMKRGGCHINSTLQIAPSLKGTPGCSVTHVSGIALSCSGTSVSVSQATRPYEKDSASEQHRQHELCHEREANKKTKPSESKSGNRARKALRTISIILGAYVLCWTPYHVMVFVIGICGDWSCINLKFYYFTYWLCYLNSPINPFCYAFANAQFKRTFIRILKFDLHRT